jgi:hypothetical protein
MKKLIVAAAAALAMSAAIARVTGIVEYDSHVMSGLANKSGYYAVGLAKSTEYGIFDTYAQGVKATSYTGVVDNLNGWEFGYGGYFVNTINLNPRIAYGAMNNIDLGGYVGNARYVLASLEASTAITGPFTGYTSYSHMAGTNDASIRSSNRVQLGVDTALSDTFTIRLGYSRIWQLDTIQNGVVVMGFYTF